MSLRSMFAGLTSSAFCVIALATAVAPVQAQELEEIIVTAQKREQNLQDVPISITAYTSDQIKDLRIVTTTDVVDYTPGLVMNSPLGEGNTPTFGLRGVSSTSFNAELEAPIAVYADEIYYGTAFGAVAQIYDIERFEALRGPQGTLFGRNASGGLLHFITAKPEFEELGGFVDLTVGEYNEVTLNAALNIPLGENWATRVSVGTQKYDGYVDNIFPGGVDPSDTDKVAGRVQLAYQGDRFRFNSNLHYAEDDSHVGAWQVTGSYVVDAAGNRVENMFDPATGEAAVDATGQVLFFDAAGNQVTAQDTRLDPNEPVFFPFAPPFIDDDGDVWTGNYDFIDELYIENTGGWARFEYDVSDNIELISLTGIEEFNQRYYEDSDLGPVSSVRAYFGAQNRQWSQEFRLEGSTDRINWVGGLYYYDRETNNSSFNVLLPLVADFLGFNPVPHTVGNTTTESAAIFGQADFALTDQWTLTAGLRYTDEEQTLDQTTGTIDISLFGGDLKAYQAALPTPANTASLFDDFAANSFSFTDDFVTGKLELGYRPTEQIMIYGSYSVGSKSGGFNDDPRVALNPFVNVVYDREQLKSFELGVRSQFAENRVRLNVSLFDYDYEDYQANQPVGPRFTVFTNNDSEISGMEVELWAAPTDGLTLLLAGATLFDTNVENIRDNFGNTRDREMAMAPDYQFNGLIRYDWDAFGGMLSAQTDFVYSAQYYSGISNFTGGVIPAYNKWGARLAYSSPDDTWYIAANVENLFNDENLVSVFDFSSTDNYSQLGYTKPRWFSVSFGYNF